jgi:CheY-like chemotaxis protein
MYVKDKLSMYSKTILLVDDVPLFSEMAKAQFRRDQINILTAQSGSEAVDIIRNKKPDLVFMDLYMPGGDGDEICREIKSDNQIRSTPVFIVTSSNNHKDLERCQKAGCNGFINKPLTREKVMEACKNNLKLPKWSGKRAKVSIPASFGNVTARESSGLLTDISIGGVFLETEAIRHRNSTIYIEFRLSDTHGPIKCKGRVAWILEKVAGKPTGMGIEFTDISSLELLVLQSWLSSIETN